MLLTLLVSWAALKLVHDSVFEFMRVENESMLPYFPPRTLVGVLHTNPCLRLPFLKKGFLCSACSPGEAYVFEHPTMPDEKLIKFAVSSKEFNEGRAHLASGDIIWFTTQGAKKDSVDIPVRSSNENVCYFIGSNSEHSIDSRTFGPIPAESIEGRVLYPFWKEHRKKNP